ncbi:MAG: M10 family metallopeptidase C-terminal domain-containing protein [Devosia sp.]
MAGWPDSTNTGVPDGVTLLPSGSIIVTKPGTVISGLDIKGTVYIDADNVTIENCKITASAYSVVQIKTGSTGVIIQDCEINGVGSNNDGSHGINGVGTFLRNDIYNVENGINVGGGSSGTVIEGNYIHDLKASGSPHYDGIQIDGGQSNITIQHNTVINENSQTSAVMIDNYFGPVSNVVVNDNLLVGGGYTVYADAQFSGGALSGIQITNNHIGGGYYGTLNANQSSPVYTGNLLDGNSVVTTLNGHGNDTSGGNGSVTPPVVAPPIDTTPTPTTPGSTAATNGADHLLGDAKANVMDGLGGNDVIEGGAGIDHLIGGAGYDTLTGGAGNDVFVFRSASEIGDRPGARDIITDFTQGQDKIDLSGIDANGAVAGHQDFTFVEGNDSSFSNTPGELAWHTAGGNTIVQGDLDGDGVHDFEIELTGNVSLKASDFIGVGSASTEPTPVPPTVPVTPPPVVPTTPEGASPTIITGTQGSDRLNGDSASNYLLGQAGNDTINGGAGNDWLDGGAGRDYLTGGAGNDIFVFKSVSDMGTRTSTRDVITDFTQGQDKIDLSALDANSHASGNQTFSFLTGNDQSFSHTDGELAWRIDAAHNQTIIQGDINGDGVHDFEIQLTGQIHLTAADFIL